MSAAPARRCEYQWCVVTTNAADALGTVRKSSHQFGHGSPQLAPAQSVARCASPGVWRRARDVPQGVARMASASIENNWSISAVLIVSGGEKASTLPVARASSPRWKQLRNTS